VVEVKVDDKLDTLGNMCPKPMLMIKDKLPSMDPGDVLEVIGDAVNRRSVERYIKNRGHEIISVNEEGDKFTIIFRKAEKEKGDTPISTCILK